MRLPCLGDCCCSTRPRSIACDGLSSLCAWPGYPSRSRCRCVAIEIEYTRGFPFYRLAKTESSVAEEDPATKTPEGAVDCQYGDDVRAARPRTFSNADALWVVEARDAAAAGLPKGFVALSVDPDFPLVIDAGFEVE